MKLYFADTWYFVALLNRRDVSYRAAARLERSLRDDHLVTHDGVLTELLNFHCEYGAAVRTNVGRYVRDVMDDPGVTVYECSRSLFLAGLSLYERRRDKEYSLVDCLSMHVMQAHGITHVLTNDHHFRQEGFTVISDAQ
jgi:predicted nucleic acid-binding protein